MSLFFKFILQIVTIDCGLWFSFFCKSKTFYYHRFNYASLHNCCHLELLLRRILILSICTIVSIKPYQLPRCTVNAVNNAKHV